MTGHMSPHLHQTIYLEPYSSIDMSGNASYSAGSTYPARIERRVRKVITTDGMEAVSSLVIYLDNDVSMNMRGLDRVTLPAGYYGETQPRILQVLDVRDYVGTLDHYEVYT